MKNKYLLKFRYLVIPALIIVLTSCQKEISNASAPRKMASGDNIAAIKFFLKTTLNVTDDKVLYDTKKQEFDVYDLKYPLAVIEKTYSEANEFKAKYKLQ